MLLLHLHMTLRHAPRSLLIRGCTHPSLPPGSPGIYTKWPQLPHRSLGYTKVQGCWALGNSVAMWPYKRESPQGSMSPPVCGIIQTPKVCHYVKGYHLVIFTGISLITKDVRRPSVHSPLPKIFN